MTTLQVPVRAAAAAAGLVKAYGAGETGVYALLRALGLTRGQLRRTLLTEALLMAALAVLLGFALGIGFSAAIVHALGRLGVLSVPYLRLLLYALAAAVLPARRAAKTSIIKAITALC
jgi:putative ABC transport system permease protein